MELDAMTEEELNEVNFFNDRFKKKFQNGNVNH